MTSKSSIKPPPIPSGEDPLITIGNQEKQLDMLLKRIEVLTEQCDTYAKDCRQAEAACDIATAEIKRLEAKVADMRVIATRMLGWQDAALVFFDKISGK